MLNSHGNESCSNHVELRMRATVNDVCHVVMRMDVWAHGRVASLLIETGGTLGPSRSPGQMWNQIKRIRCGAPGRVPSHRDRGTRNHTLQHTSRELRTRTTVRSMLNSHGNESCSNHVELRMRTTVNDVCHVVRVLAFRGPRGSATPVPPKSIFGPRGRATPVPQESDPGAEPHRSQQARCHDMCSEIQ